MAVRQIVAIVALPVTFTVVVPLVFVSPADDVAWWAATIGVVMIAVGLVLAVSTIWNFATRGRGTLAPWDPPKRLVISGAYRYVRNPMITGVLLILFGESLVLGSRGLALLGAVFVLVNAIYIPLVEEKGLARRFGADYEEYRRNVPRWIPRLTPWTGGGARGE